MDSSEDGPAPGEGEEQTTASPLSLQELCIPALATNLETSFPDDAYLPEAICYRVLEALVKTDALNSRRTLMGFRRYSRRRNSGAAEGQPACLERCRLRHLLLDFREAPCSSQAFHPEWLRTLTGHPLEMVVLRGIDKEDGNGLTDIANILRPFETTLQHLDLTQTKVFNLRGLNLFQHLRTVTLRDCGKLQLQQLPVGLEHLDMSFSQVQKQWSLYLSPLTMLKTLRLPSVALGDRELNAIAGLPELETLDAPAEFVTENLEPLLRLRRLRWLNISKARLWEDTLEKITRLPELRFLAVCGCSTVPRSEDGFESLQVAQDVAIPSTPTLQIASLRSRDQILLAMRTLLPSTDLLNSAILQAVVPYFSANAVDAIEHDCGITEAVFTVMHPEESTLDRNPEEPRTQLMLDLLIVSSAILFYVTKPDMGGQTPEHRLKALEKLMLCLEQHELQQLTRNCCLALTHFSCDEVAQFSDRLAKDLFTASLRNLEDRNILMSSTFVCCHSLASLHPTHKLAIGAQGCIEDCMELISFRIQADDENLNILDACWTFLWNITDEAPVNSERFLANGGMACIINLLETYPAAMTLRRNVMGLVTNIAEVRELRPQLMNRQILAELSQCLENTADLEVTYNVSGTLCHLISEGRDFWVEHGFDLEARQSLLTQIVTTVNSWDVAQDRWINYRSLQPVIRLLRTDLEPEVHYWATWALASLCTVDGAKYCPMCWREGAVEKLAALWSANSPAHMARTREMMQVAMQHCNEHRDPAPGALPPPAL